jgi:hypothetical protein
MNRDTKYLFCGKDGIDCQGCTWRNKPWWKRLWFLILNGNPVK